ncbi:MAG: TetR/AcrR family transcriptional regulator [Alphaproteobacteria bacterium]|nr:TetR/AcrR family transcriptional regulator [Alphaproteobacteria bacterium]
MALMDAAARLFADQGYSATTIRDIAGAAGMLPGSVYYHFPSKTALLLEVYREGVAGLARRVDSAVAAAGGEPWARLEAAAAAHLETVLDQSAYAKVMIRVLPDDADDGAVAKELAAARDEYESRFRTLIGALALADRADARLLRLMLLGALNWTQTWYRAGGASPAAIARDFVKSVKQGVSP